MHGAITLGAAVITEHCARLEQFTHSKEPVREVPLLVLRMYTASIQAALSRFAQPGQSLCEIQLLGQLLAQPNKPASVHSELCC